MNVRLFAVTATTGSAALALVLSAGCAESGTSIESIRHAMDGDVHAEKPAGVRIEREDDEWEAGPPPYGYIRITGEPVPGWTGEQTPAAEILNWTFVGPQPMSSEYWSGNANAGGRVVSIAPHPTNANICYIGSASGGVWKTSNGGGTWTPMTDELSILNHGMVALSPVDPNIVYAGTGEYMTGSTGDGVFRSIDAGVTWTRLATAGQVGNQISGLSGSTDPLVLHVTSSSGYYRTNDSGATWTQKLSGSCSSLVVQASNPSIVFVGVRSQGIYRSTDAGLTFTKMTAGLPASGFGYIALTQCANTPSVLYAALLNGSSLQGMYRSADGGTTWTQKTATPNFPSPQGSYNCMIAVNPNDANMVFAGGVDSRYAVVGVTRTLNGGDSWTEVAPGPSQLHPDHHAMAFGPGNTIWEANDGGIYKSTNNGTNWTNLNSTLAAGQIYQIAVHPTSTLRMLGGTQDNGTPEKISASLDWPQLQTGDGGFSVYDPTSTTRRYTTYVYLSVYRWNGGSDTEISGPWGNDSANFIAPLVGDPNSSTTLLGGTNRVWRTTNSTTSPPTWTAISGTEVVGSNGTLNAIAVAPGSSSTIWAGATSGRVSVTTNASTWNNRSAGLVSGQVSDIVVSPTDPGTAYVSFFNSTGNRIFKTTNYGVNWTNMTGTLPSGVAGRALAIDWSPRRPGMYVGSGAGVWVSLNNGRNWYKDGTSLPNVNVGDLLINPAQRFIVAGTYGRGGWQATLPTPCDADFNGDGQLDFFDYLDFSAAFDSGSIDADFNGDAQVDFFDYLDYVQAFSLEC
jgi:photosystem II stability/assembly factor-like uncharacterized protein